MPSKHVDENVWRKVEKKTMEAIFATEKPIKETTVLKWLILKGLEEITEEDFRRLAKK